VGHGNRLIVHKEPKKVWEIYSGAPGKSMPAPDAGIHVKDLKFAVAGILLELDFHKPGKVS
jgi:hypothetical protein